LLKMESGAPQKIPEFKNIWQNRHSYWGPKDSPSKSSPKPRNVDIYDMNSLTSENNSTFRTPTAPMLSKAHQQSSSMKSMEPPTTGTRRKLNASIEDDAHNNQPKKKRRSNIATTGNHAVLNPPAEHPSVLPSTGGVEDALREDPVTTENVNFAQEYLSSAIDPEPQPRPKTLPRMQSIPKDTRPMTPTSPAVASHLLDRDNQTSTTTGRAVPVSSFASGSSNPATSPGLGALNTSPAPPIAGNQALSTNQRLVLVLEKSDGSYNDDDPLPHTHLRDSNVNEFFSLVAEISNKPLDSLHCLTFTFMFAPLSNQRVIQKGDEAEWSKLKKKVLFLFNINRIRMDDTEFQLVVEIGDKRNIVTGMDAMWGA